MKDFGVFLANLRSNAGLSLEDLAKLVDSSRSTLSRLENNDVPQPFRGSIRKLIIALAEILCTSKKETERYLELAGIERSLLTEAEEIQLGSTPHITPDSPDEVATLARWEGIYEQLLRHLEAQETELSIGSSLPNLKLKIQEYSNILQEIRKRLDIIDHRLSGAESSNPLATRVPIISASQPSPTRDDIIKLLQPLIDNPQCALTDAWNLGVGISDIQLEYDSASQYEDTMPDDVRQTIEDWCRENQDRYNKLRIESQGVQVRLERVEWSHHTITETGAAIRQFKYFIWLSPARYLTYLAIHQRLGKAQLRPLRKRHFDNALLGLRSGLKLPSHFALHMAVVSQDGHLLLRQRTDHTELYPLAWEAGIGEFMHGPHTTPDPEFISGPYHFDFPHFENGTPSLFLFLKNAVAEELGYDGAEGEDFRLYGFAVEYETLAPKLLVIYHSKCPIATLKKSMRQTAKDRAYDVSSIEFTPCAIAEACSGSSYSSWGPTSKLVMLYALKQDLEAKDREDQSSKIQSLINCFKLSCRDSKLADPWKSHK